jgi:glutamate N-acetyltransferase/amino-acid N-acetyltransferase
MTLDNLIVPGFQASAVAAGLKKNKDLDLALIFSDTDAVAAGVFTTNKVKAAPVLVCMDNIQNNRAQAIIVNAGNANACTGGEGFQNARKTTETVANALGIPPRHVLVASTGVIGAQLNMKQIQNAIPDLVQGLAPDGLSQAAKAIMTTDSFPKFSRFEGNAGKTPYCIVGIAKGAGMIMPNMATMLCFILSDIRIDAVNLKSALSTAVEESFNRITVDGDTSTNDTVLILANGMADNPVLDTQDLDAFRKGLTKVMTDLAVMVVRDGEGASKLVHVHVKGAASQQDAHVAARVVANSNLVKTAFYGQDPNWGRIMAALGRSEIDMNEAMVSIWINDVQIVENGLGLGANQEKKAGEEMHLKEFDLFIDLHQGNFEDHIFTCDLTHDYVSINADYRS